MTGDREFAWLEMPAQALSPGALSRRSEIEAMLRDGSMFTVPPLREQLRDLVDGGE